MPWPNRIKVRGKFWKLRKAALRNCRGECDPPEKVGKEIRVKQGLGSEETLEILFHEIIHAAGWHIAEEFVAELAADAARAAHKCGYRITEE